MAIRTIVAHMPHEGQGSGQSRVIEVVRPGTAAKSFPSAKVVREMRILRLDPGDDDAVRGCFDVREAVRQADDPSRPPESFRVLHPIPGRAYLDAELPVGSALPPGRPVASRPS